jgi:flagellar L-ring protein precursor FlgH
MKYRADYLLAAFFLFCTQAQASDLFVPGSWSSLASDQVARKVGDVLTVVVYENSTGSGSAENTVSKNTSLQGNISAGNPVSGSGGLQESANLGLGHTADNAGTTTRTGAMVGEISVTVDALLPNGDLHVTGAQILNINGERTRIAVKGEVRLADISSSNIILSTSLADATIDYEGAGLVTESSKAGWLTRALNFLGLP